MTSKTQKHFPYWQILLHALTLVAVAVMLVISQRAKAAYQANTSHEQGANAVIPYQGTLTNSVGQPVNGEVDITFRLYASPTEGTPLWEEVHSGDNAITVEHGLFHVNLGSLSPIPNDVWNTHPLYLGVQVGSDPEMSPRSLVGSVPYALHVASNAVNSDSIVDGSVTRYDLAPFTGVVWKVPPVRLREDVAWTPSENAVWDIGTFLDEQGVPSDAEVLLIGLRPSRLSDVSVFEFLDADDNVLGKATLGTNIDTTWSAIGIEYGTMFPIPGNTRKIRYSNHGGAYQDASHPRRLLILFGWK